MNSQGGEEILGLKETQNTIGNNDKNDDFEVGSFVVGKKEESLPSAEKETEKKELTEAEKEKNEKIERLKEELEILKGEYKRIKEKNDASFNKFKNLFRKEVSLGSAKEEEEKLQVSIGEIEGKIAALQTEESKNVGSESNIKAEKTEKPEPEAPKEEKKSIEEMLENNSVSGEEKDPALNVLYGFKDRQKEEKPSDIKKEMQEMYKNVTDELSERSILNWQLIRKLKFDEIKSKAGDKLDEAIKKVVNKYYSELGEEANPKGETLAEWAERVTKASMKRKLEIKEAA